MAMSLIAYLMLMAMAIGSIFAPFLIGVAISVRFWATSEQPVVGPIGVAAILLGSYLFAMAVSFSDWGAPVLWETSETFGGLLFGERLARVYWLPVVAGMPLGYAFGWLWRSKAS